ncbi:MAG: HEAT repeat domain-containing protein [Planctomycetes bacterium]|nr:HEAT repeat domain-containing protein [Planctomycetota bacterium]
MASCLVLLVGTALGGCAGQGPVNQEPVLGGKPMSYWVERARVKIPPSPLNPFPFHDPREANARMHAIGVLSRFGAPAVPALLDLLQDKDYDFRWYAAKALGRIGPAASAAVPALMEALMSDNTVGFCSARALGQIGPKAQAAVPALIRALEDPADIVRMKAAHALWMIGPAAEAALPALHELAEKDEDETVRAIAKQATGLLTESPPVLIERLKDPEQRAAAAKKLRGPEIFPFIMELFSSSDPQARRGAVYALGVSFYNWGERREEARSALQRALADPDGVVRAQAAQALGDGQP